MKGFLTLATGKDIYYMLAHNLLLSYRLHSLTSTPFAILCDRMNEWTGDFDQAVVIDNPSFTYMDKMRMMDLSPFDETIFIEADSLIYKDPDGMWDLFRDGPDIGLLGRTYPKDSEKGWWKDENLGELKDKVDCKVICQGGVYYVRNNGKELPAFRQTCKFIEQNYNSYRFSFCEDTLEDENVLCLASAVHHFHPVSNWFDVFAYYPEVIISKSDIRKGVLKYTWPNGSCRPARGAYLIHFVTKNTLSPKCDGLYYREVSKIKYNPDRRLKRKNSLAVYGRRIVNNSRFFKAIANLFPKELRNRYNKVTQTSQTSGNV